MTGAMVATAIVFFPAAPLFLFMKGKDITIPKGHEVTCYTNTDLDTRTAVGPGGQQPQQPVSPVNPLAPAAPTGIPAGQPVTDPAPPPAPPPVTAASPQALDAAGILQMKSGGLSEEVILSMAKKRRVVDFAPDDLIKMKAAGFSDATLAKLLELGTK